MDITINHIHSIELHGAAIWALIIVLVVLAVCLMAPMVVPFSPAPLPAAHKEPMGFHN